MKTVIVLSVLVCAAVYADKDQEADSRIAVSEDAKKTEKRGLVETAAPALGYSGPQGHAEQVIYATAAPSNYATAAPRVALTTGQFYSTAVPQSLKIGYAQQAPGITYAQSDLSSKRYLSPAYAITSSKVSYAQPQAQTQYVYQPQAQAQYVYQPQAQAQYVYQTEAQAQYAMQPQIQYVEAQQMTHARPSQVTYTKVASPTVYANYDSVSPATNKQPYSRPTVQQVYPQPAYAKPTGQSSHGHGAVSYASFTQSIPSYSHSSNTGAVQYTAAPLLAKVANSAPASSQLSYIPQLSYQQHQPAYTSAIIAAPQTQVFAALPKAIQGYAASDHQALPSYGGAHIISAPQLSYSAPQLAYSGHQGKLAYAPVAQVAYSTVPQVSYARLEYGSPSPVAAYAQYAH